MRYIIMNRNSLEGYQKGYMETLPPCFYEYTDIDDSDIPRYHWTSVVGSAFRFKSEADAWDFATRVWGLKFAYTNYMVISVHHEGLERSEESRELIMEGLEARAAKMHWMHFTIRDAQARIKELENTNG